MKTVTIEKNIRQAIRDAYDPLHPIKVKLSCTKCPWTDEFTVQPRKGSK